MTIFNVLTRDGFGAVKRTSWLACALLLFGVISICTAPPTKASGFYDLDHPPLTVRMPNRVTMIAIARAGNRLVAVGIHGIIIYSDDNGATWRQASAPVDVTFTAIAFASPTEGWVVGHYGVILHTVDAGATWQMQLNGIAFDQTMLANAQSVSTGANLTDEEQRALRRANILAGAGPTKPFLSLVAFDPMNIMVFGANRMAARTTNGGKTWADWSLNIGDPVSHHLYDAKSIGGDIYVVGEAGLMFRSTDGGKTFPQVSGPMSNTLFGIINTGDNGILTFGVAGQAFLSVDGGQTWQDVSFPISTNLTDALTLKNGTVLVLGEDGELFISTDHGHNFRNFGQSQPMGLFGAVQAANGDVIVAGSLGVLSIPAADFAQD